MRKRKGAVPVIATMLLLTIVAAAALVVYGYVSGASVLPDSDQHTGKMLEKLKTVEVKGYDDGQIRVYIMNTGSVDSVVDVFYVNDFNGNPIFTIPVNAEIAVGETKEFIFDTFVIGNGPWSWYEIMAVTERSNKVRANLFAFYSGAYELGPRPGEFESDSGWFVSNVTQNGVPVDPGVLPDLIDNITYIDENNFNQSTGDVETRNTPHPISSFEYNTSSTKFDDPMTDPIEWLETAEGTPEVFDYQVHLDPVTGFRWVKFQMTGNTGNMKYPMLNFEAVFYINPSNWAAREINGSIQFYDWVAQKYVTTGNGFFTYTKGNLTGGANNYWNLTTGSFPRGNLINEQGEWKVLFNYSTNRNTEFKLDYIAVTENNTYTNDIETVFAYDLNGINQTKVTRILFSMTGIFPEEASFYWFSVYNFDERRWDYLGTILGSASPQTATFEVVLPQCQSVISDSPDPGIIEARISPGEEITQPIEIQIDQAKMILRQLTG